MLGGLFLRSLVLCFKATSDWAVQTLFNCKSEIWLNKNSFFGVGVITILPEGGGAFEKPPPPSE